MTREDCLALDAVDPLAGHRALFEVPPGVIYLDGNSLGVLPKAVPARLAKVVADEWGRDLIRSWNTAGWIDLPAKVGAKIAPLIGAYPDEVIACDSTSVNLFKLAAGALALRPDRHVIVTEPGNFPSDLYILQGLADLKPGLEIRVTPRAELAAALDDSVALLLLTEVHYKTGELHDMAALSAKAREAGALTLWDLSHSAGAMPVNLTASGADLAVGCGYKYLNGGPGAPAFAYVARRHQGAFKSPLTGWMGHAQPFAFDDDYRPGMGMARLLCGTPQVLNMSALDVALSVFEGIDMGMVRAKSMALGDLFLTLVQDRCDGLSPACPLGGAQRGSQVALRHPNGYAIVQALIDRGVIGDFRAPDILRFGLTPLYIGFADVWDAVDHLAQIMATEAWREPRYAEVAAVT